MPERQTEGAIGFDVFLRAIVDAEAMDAHNPKLRKTVFDFETIPSDPAIRHFVDEQNGTLRYRLEGHKQILAGIGFCAEMPFPYFYWVAPRSGLASRYSITVMNTPGTVDPDYRGEAGVVLVNHSENSFFLTKNMRIAQIIFMPATIPTFEVVPKYSDLLSSERGVGGFGSTGLE